MKRDFKTMRTILEKVEADTLEEYIETPVEEVENEKQLTRYVERKRQNILSHLLLLTEGGFVAGADVKITSNGFVFCGYMPRLTNKGHDLLAMFRSDAVSAKIKNIVEATGIPITVYSLQLLQHEAIDELIRERKKQTKVDY